MLRQDFGMLRHGSHCLIDRIGRRMPVGDVPPDRFEPIDLVQNGCRRRVVGAYGTIRFGPAGGGYRRVAAVMFETPSFGWLLTGLKMRSRIWEAEGKHVRVSEGSNERRPDRETVTAELS